MKYFSFKEIGILLLVVLLAVSSLSFCTAQKLLNHPVSVTANKQSVSQVLQTLSTQGNFYFSYSTAQIPGDSIVTLSIHHKPLKVVLDQLLSGNYMYKETGNYIIVQPAPHEKNTYITGFISDVETGKPVDYASIYSKTLLVATLSQDDGSFRLKLRDRTFPLHLTISKVGYADTSLVVNSAREVSLNLQLTPKAVDLDEVMVYNHAGDRTWLARLFVSSRLREQSRNIGKFFVALPYQASLTPGLGTHGRMSGQVTNKFSMNLLGGYTAGVNGLEVAGGFNISKSNVRVAQMAGIFNVVAGSVQGVQVAGLHNHVLDSLSGVQMSGFGNLVNKRMRGVQLGGFFNIAGSKLNEDTSHSGVNAVQIAGGVNYIRSNSKGVQAAGALNMAERNFSGVQIAGIVNTGSREVDGLQLGPVNYARNLKGLQIGVVNIADSSSGYSFGLVNIVKHGKGAVSLHASDLTLSGVAWKTGTSKLYSILMLGADWRPDKKAYTIGYGLGSEFRLHRSLQAAIEVSSSSLYAGNIDSMVSALRLQTLVNVPLSRRLILSAGPACSVMFGTQSESVEGFASFPRKTYTNFNIGKSVTGWLGWQLGLVWEYGKVL
jgi:hypothetical protein